MRILHNWKIKKREHRFHKGGVREEKTSRSHKWGVKDRGERAQIPQRRRSGREKEEAGRHEGGRARRGKEDEAGGARGRRHKL